VNISEIGEFGFIDAIKEDTLFKPDSVVVGIGDDGAVYQTTDGMDQVSVIDTMVENSHFIIGRTGQWYDVGYKAVASNLSDIAAMGAIPTHLVLSTAIAPSMEVQDLKELYRGIKDICQRHGVNILGGDTVTSKEGMVITVAAFGEIEKGKALLRSTAQVGDIVAVSHTIGDSGAGLETLLQGIQGYDALKKAHRFPEPQIELGRLLVKHHCHSLNDISDGLASESNEIAKASHVRLVIDKVKIPLSDGVRQWASEVHKSPWSYAFNGGEDYELVFTMDPTDFKSLQREYPAVTEIGTVCQGQGDVLVIDEGTTHLLSPTGWTHF
jgi:thiamine-monophosphate kinase